MSELTKREAAEVDRPVTIYQVFAQMAQDPNIDPARIAALMELQIKAEDRNAEREFNAAFARLLPTLPRLTKKGTIDMGTKGTMKFLRYEDLDKILRPIYTTAGFSLSFVSEPSDKGIILVAQLSHEAGHRRESRLQLPADTGAGRNALQALGSSLSYAKRYLTCDLFNIVTVGEDDDATGSSALTEDQSIQIEALIADNGLQAWFPALLDVLNVKALSDLQRVQFPTAMNLIRAKARSKGTK